MPDDPHVDPGPDEAGDTLGTHSARAAGARLRELAEDEHARVEADEAEPHDVEPPGAGEVEPAPPHPLALLGAVPFSDALLESYGPDVGDFRSCPFCDGYGAVNPDELIAALPQVIERLAPFPASTVFVRCTECDGWGSVLTGGRTGENGIQPCPVCMSHGYLDVRSAGSGPTGIVAGGGTAPGGAAGDERDPFTLAPPDGVPPAAGMEWDHETGRWGYPVRAA